MDEIPAPKKFNEVIDYKLQQTTYNFALEPYSIQPYTCVFVCGYV